MFYFERLAREGKLLYAGPFLDTGEVRGIYLFNVQTIDEAKALTETDPAIREGRWIMELHPYYGSAALMKIPEIHERVQKKGLVNWCPSFTSIWTGSEYINSLASPTPVKKPC